VCICWIKQATLPHIKPPSVGFVGHWLAVIADGYEYTHLHEIVYLCIYCCLHVVHHMGPDFSLAPHPLLHSRGTAA